MIRMLVLALAVYGVCAWYERVVRGPEACIGIAADARGLN